MRHLRRKFNYALVLVLIAASIGLAHLAWGAEVTLTATYQSGSLSGQTPVGQLQPNSTVRLSAQFSGDQAVCTDSLGYTLWRALAHAKDGDADNRGISNLEYLMKGPAETTPGTASFNYDFNSGPAGQKNAFWAVFYCWSNGDNPQSALGTAQQWISNTFSQDTEGGRCNLSVPVWGESSGEAGDSVEMRVTGTQACQGREIKFEIWQSGLAGRMKDEVAARFPSSGNAPFIVKANWTITAGDDYYFKARVPDPNGAMARSGSLSATDSDGDGDGNGGTASATLEFRNPLGAKDLRELIDAILRWIFWISIPIAVIMIVYAGLQMMLAGGDAAKFGHGKKILLWAVIGLAVIFIGEGFIALIRSILALGK
ncbi:MAG: pilin [bacterium]|nr:pilin [bacterium]